jgi:hypothetical protein
MQRSRLEHLIRAAGEITNQCELDDALRRAAELEDGAEATRAAAWILRLASSAA